jgi:hypothetical protein
MRRFIETARTLRCGSRASGKRLRSDLRPAARACAASNLPGTCQSKRRLRNNPVVLLSCVACVQAALGAPRASLSAISGACWHRERLTHVLVDIEVLVDGREGPLGTVLAFAIPCSRRRSALRLQDGEGGARLRPRADECRTPRSSATAKGRADAAQDHDRSRMRLVNKIKEACARNGSGAMVLFCNEAQQQPKRPDARVQAVTAFGVVITPSDANASIASASIPNQSARISAVCSPNSGAGSNSRVGVFDILGTTAGTFNGPRRGCSIVAILPRAL